MTTKFPLKEFKKLYGTHDKCLEALKRLRFPNEMNCPKCKRVSTFHRVTNRTAYACKFCGHHLYPLAGTIFEKSTTSLDLWFFAMYLMVQTRSGISAKQLERMLGVTYKTAWRMFKQIRTLMADTDTSLLSGVVETDETFVGGASKNRKHKYDFGEEHKEVVMGMLERNGKAYFKHVPNTGKWTLINQIKHRVDPTATVVTDQWAAYASLPQYGYDHQSVNHQQTYINGIAHTQNLENFWSLLKRGIFGVYRKVSKKYLQAYVDEYGFRYNNRKAGGEMFNVLLSQVPQVRSVAVEPLA